jgi:hypothetical protein
VTTKRTFNSILREGGLSPTDVRLLRHRDKDAEAEKGTPYKFWLTDPDKFVRYQEHQAIYNRRRLDAPYWAAFVVTPENETVFAGLYTARYTRTLSDEEHQTCDVHHRLGRCDLYNLIPDERLRDHIGRLVIDWSPSHRVWIQRADRQNKLVVEEADQGLKSSKK